MRHKFHESVFGPRETKAGCDHYGGGGGSCCDGCRFVAEADGAGVSGEEARYLQIFPYWLLHANNC
jgi:hypothetical protein